MILTFIEEEEEEEEVRLFYIQHDGDHISIVC